MDELIDELSVAIPSAFDGDEYRAKAGEIESQSRQREIAELSELRDRAANAHIIVAETPTGYSFTPANENNEEISPEEFNKFDKDKQREIQNTILDLQGAFSLTTEKIPRLAQGNQTQIAGA